MTLDLVVVHAALKNVGPKPSGPGALLVSIENNAN
jgi:hypothetical protein